MYSGSQQPPSELDHLKPRYSFHKVCRLFGVSSKTLNRWIKDGVPLGHGRRTTLSYLPIGGRKKEFEVDEVERVYKAMKGAGAALPDVAA